jgi:hypothetical protein
MGFAKLLKIKMIKKILNFFFIVGTIVLSRKMLAFFLYLIYLFFALLVMIYFFFYQSYIEKIKIEHARDKLTISHDVSTSTIEDVSYLANFKKSTFNNFLREKEDGIIRIGAFGDSHTHGDEVDYESDYPSILQELFLRNGYDNVEVLNFGSGGWGNFSSFRLWELEGREYNLDFILFGPYGFWLERDLVFNWSLSNHSDIHGRYILKKDNIKYVKPLGGLDVNERFKAYHGFIPKLRYLLYDKNPPIAIRSLLKENKTIDNPFYYYQGGLEEEHSKIYGHLFEKMSKEIKQMINIIEMGMGCEIDFSGPDFNKINNLYFSEGFRLKNDIFKAQNGHAGPLHNNMLAYEYFNVLTGKNEQFFEIIKTFNSSNKNIEVLNQELFDFGDINNLTIDFNENIIGVLINNFHNFDVSIDDYSVLDPIAFYKENQIKSFIFLKTKDKKIEESLFLPLDFEISPDMEFVVKSVNGDIEENFGKIKMIRSNIGFVESDLFSFNWANMFDGKRVRGGFLFLGTRKNLDNYSLYLGDKIIYNIKRESSNEQKNALHPNKFNHFIFRSKIAYPQYIDDYEESGDLYLSLRKDNQILEKIKIGKWQKEEINFPINQSKIKYFIGKNEEGKAVILENN